MAKKLTEIDKNLLVETAFDKPVKFYNVKEKPFKIYGLYSPEQEGPFCRLPKEIADATNEGVAVLYRHTSGGRIRFKTNAKYMIIKAEVSGLDMMPHHNLMGHAGMDVFIKENGKYRFWYPVMTENGNAAGEKINERGSYSNLIPFDEGIKDVTVNMPLYVNVNNIFIGFNPEATVSQGDSYRDIPPVVYYGSSITQGGCATRPGNNYPAILSRDFDMDFRNFGFSGSARGEQVIAEYIAAQDMSAFVYDYDYNAPTLEHLAKTHEPMYLTVRKAHPDIPVFFMTRPKTRYNDEEKARRNVVMTTYKNAKSRGENVYFIDGEKILEIFGGDGGTVDGCHPNDMGFGCMAAALRPYFKEIFE